MSSVNPGHTTLPSASSKLGAGGPERWALSWLFPRTDGPRTEFGEGRTFSVQFGRGEECDVVLSGQEVSRRHAELRFDGVSATLRDLQSRNGTFVNGQRISSVPLQLDDVVRIGGWVGVVTLGPIDLGSVAPGVYAGPKLRSALHGLDSAARSDLPIILEGETGTGKEVLSRAIHAWSGRSGPFVAVNCAALPEALAEGELFGYRKGAFTGADAASPGYFRSAQRGTLLLDEICDLPLVLQAKLLRVLEQHEVQPLGESSPARVDVRVLAAAQEPLERAVREGRFRGDLFARLDGLTVKLPPLRERRAEIPYLFSRFLLEYAGARPPGVEARLVERLCLYDWPFNVRELALLLKRMLVLYGTEETLKAANLPERLLGEVYPASHTPQSRSVAPAVALGNGPEPADRGKSVSLPALLAALRESGGNVARAASALGISRQRAYRMMQGQVDLDSLRDAPGEQ